MSEPPEHPRPLFADEDFFPARPLTGPPTEPMFAATPAPPEYDPPPSRTPLVVAVVILALIALVLGGTTAYAITSGGSASSDLQAQLDSANTQVDTLNTQVSDLQSQLDQATQNGTDQTSKIDKLTSKVKSLRKQVKASVPASTFPVVVFEGSANKKLKAAFQKQLIDPMLAEVASNNQAQGTSTFLVAVDIVVPVNTGDPYSYMAIYSTGGYDSAQYGTRGNPLPLWTPGCDAGCG